MSGGSEFQGRGATTENALDLEVHFCIYVTLENIRSTTSTTTTTARRLREAE